MGELGADTMLICSSVSPVALGGVDRAAGDLRELGEPLSTIGFSQSARHRSKDVSAS